MKGPSPPLHKVEQSPPYRIAQDYRAAFQIQSLTNLPGRYGCVGKNLALSELRFVTALLIKKYVVCFAPNEDGKSVVNDLRDQFTAAPGKLNLSFELREKYKNYA